MRVDIPKLEAELADSLKRIDDCRYCNAERLAEEIEADVLLIQCYLRAFEGTPLHECEYVKMPDGTYERAAHIYGWPKVGIEGEYRLQLGSNGCGRGYLGEGWTSFSGTLAPTINVKLRHVGYRYGSMWTFHRNRAGANRGVDFTVPLRVFEVVEESHEHVSV